MTLQTIGIHVNEVGRGVFTIGGHELTGVVSAQIEIWPGKQFTACTFTVIGPLDAEMILAESDLSVAVFAPPAHSGSDGGDTETE